MSLCGAKITTAEISASAVIYSSLFTMTLARTDNNSTEKIE